MQRAKLRSPKRPIVKWLTAFAYRPRWVVSGAFGGSSKSSAGCAGGGCQPNCAPACGPTAAAAVAAIHRSHPAFVLLEVLLPDGSGIDLADQIVRWSRGFGTGNAWAAGSGGRALIGGREVGVAVDQLPLAVFQAVDVGDPHLDRAGRPAVDAHLALLVAGRVGKVSPGMDDLERVAGLSVGEPGAHPLEGLAESVPAGLAGPQAPNTLTGSQWDHMFMNGPGSPATIASLAIRWRSSVLLVKSSGSLIVMPSSGWDPSGSSALAWESSYGYAGECEHLGGAVRGAHRRGPPRFGARPRALTAAGEPAGGQMDPPGCGEWLSLWVPVRG